MKAKLIKTGNDFLLKDTNGETIAITSGTIKGRMLSLKNCQAIERGCDLDELADRMIIREENITPEIKRWLIISFKLGFQKCLEILGDKKFSEMDMNKAFRLGRSLQTDINLKKKEYKPSGHIFEEFIQSLHQTEWDVEIKMEYHPTFHIQKLDADGCLILKPLPKE